MVGAQVPTIGGELGSPMAVGRLSNSRMPVVRAVVNGRDCLCLVDSGCGCTMVSTRVAVGLVGHKARRFITADGRISCGKECSLRVEVQGRRLKVCALIVSELENLGVECLLGVDVIDRLGGVRIMRGANSKYVVTWGAACERVSSEERREVVSGAAPSPLTISDKDFEAVFADGHWTVSWRWSAGEPERLQTRVGEYKCTQAPGVHERYAEEVQSWIRKGWLIKWKGPVKGVIPLLVAVQPTKDKVRPVMDYRELNEFVESHTGDEQTAVCAEKVRKWRQLPGELKIVDLKSAYLQIHVSKDLWQYQVVRYNGVHYALTRLGFGLTCAPRIMTMILGEVLSLDPDVGRATDHYVDDIMVQESIVSADRVRKHLQAYGLESKEPEPLVGGRVLGIALSKSPSGYLEMSRGSELPEADSGVTLTKRGLFSLCGRLTGHYPVAGWLRASCSFLKRLGSEGSWDEPVQSSVRELASELVDRARSEDPVKGRWHVKQGEVTVWTDASSLALGVVIQVNNDIVEDASWLRKKSDSLHINVAELEAVGRGINLAIQWGFKAFTVATDSRSVLSWLDNTVEGRDRVRTKSAAQMLIKRRLLVIKQVIAEYELSVIFRFVPTIENKADRMTRVPKRWLGHCESVDSKADELVSAALCTGRTVTDAIWAAHLPHHLGVDRTLYLGKQIRSDLTRDQVKRVIAGCEACQRIDPAMRAENLVGQGELAVEKDWCRVAVDVTHHCGSLYLSMVDCGPSRFAIWRKLPNESAAAIVAQLRQVVIERGPFAELLMDNSTAFRSTSVEEFATEWGISLRFRAAYVPSGNGIVERNHRTIKRMAARGRITPEEATFWYNVTPRDSECHTIPSGRLFRYPWRIPYDVNVKVDEDGAKNAFSVGDEVWVKPPVPSCTKRWALGRVTAVKSKHIVCVDGMPRHVRDVRRRRGSVSNDTDESSDDGEWPNGEGGRPVTDNGENVSTEAGRDSREAQEPAPVERLVDVGLESAGEGDSNLAPEDLGPREYGNEPDEGGPRRSCRERRPPRWQVDYVP